MELIFSTIAVILSITSFVWNIRINRKREIDSALALNHSATINIESRLADIPSALKFHGINEDELIKYGVSSKEFAYLLNNFTMGSTYHIILKTKDRIFKKGSYRYNMCISEATRNVWPLLKRMLEPSQYRDRIEATIKMYESRLKNLD